MNFEEAKKELINMGKELDPDGKYVAMKVETTIYHDGEETVDCGVYMDGYGHHKAPTWIEALGDLAKEIRGNQ